MAFLLGHYQYLKSNHKGNTVKKLLIALFLSILPIITSAGNWVEGSAIGVRDNNTKRPIGIFARYDGAGTIPYISIPADTWVTIDLGNTAIWPADDMQPNLPTDTKAIFLSGILIITHPGGSITCDVYANFRAPGDDLPGTSYQMQTIEAVAGSGIRSNAAVWVPVTDRKFEFYWHYTPGCPSLVNLSIQAYVR